MSVSGATAEVADQCVADFVVARFAVCSNEFGYIHQYAGTAKAALQRMMVVERFLQRVQLSVDGKPFDGRNFMAVGLHGKHQAGLHRLAVNVDGAGTAYSLEGTANVGSGEPGDVANEVDE